MIQTLPAEGVAKYVALGVAATIALRVGAPSGFERAPSEAPVAALDAQWGEASDERFAMALPGDSGQASPRVPPPTHTHND